MYAINWNGRNRLWTDLMPDRRKLLVSRSFRHPHTGTLKVGSRIIFCTLGPTGIVRRKREGDGATPAGVWPLRCLYYRADRVPRPRTGLPVHPIGPVDGWCDEPSDRFYNRPVTLPYPASAERLMRDDHLYDLLVVLGHNDAPVRRGHGSCVFFHLMDPDRGPTAGCIAVAKDDMIALLQGCSTATSMVVAG